MNCHGCGGKGWVDSQYKGPTVCPICHGMKKAPIDKDPKKPKLKYDQDAIWTELIDNIPARIDERIAEEGMAIKKKAAGRGTVNIIAHLLFNHNVTAMGNVVLHHLRRLSISGQPDKKLTNDDLVARGYIVDENNKIRTVNDIPIGKGYVLLEKWAKSWETEEGKDGHIFSVKIDPNRKGNPLFMDDNMVAVMITTDNPEIADLAIHSLMKLAPEKINTEIINIKLHLLA